MSTILIDKIADVNYFARLSAQLILGGMASLG
jgi:hypothetical protein